MLKKNPDERASASDILNNQSYKWLQKVLLEVRAADLAYENLTHVEG